jgi:hypothetical protein
MLALNMSQTLQKNQPLRPTKKPSHGSNAHCGTKAMTLTIGGFRGGLGARNFVNKNIFYTKNSYFC